MSTRPSFIGARTTITTIAEGCFEIVPGASRAVVLRELHYISNAATAHSVSVGRPAAAGTTPTANLFQKGAGDDEASTTSGSVAWGGARPTAPANPMRKHSFAATVGVGFMYSFLGGILIKQSATFTIHNVTTGALSEVNATIEE